MLVDVVSLREVRISVDDTLTVELQLSDTPDKVLKELIESWPVPTWMTLEIDHSMLKMHISGGPQNAKTAMQWILAGREGEGPPLVAMAARYEQLIDVREALFAHLDTMIRNRPR